jgi:hypothetical protein
LSQEFLRATGNRGDVPRVAQFVAHRQAGGLLYVGIADAGQFEKMRRFHRTGGKDHLATIMRRPRLAALRLGDPHGALAVEEHACGECLGLDA